MNSTTHAPTITPALVMRKAVKPLPRLALWLFCAAYVLPGLFGRDPWKAADIASFGQMWSLSLGQASWLAPQVAGVAPVGGGILPFWLGGGSIALLSPWIDPALAARLPFAALLIMVLALTWYTTYHLARTDAAQPLPLAFGGEAPTADYARALADGSLLALISTLGLLQLGHETTPEMLQLTGSALLLYGLAAAPYQTIKSKLATVCSLLILASSGSPTVAMLLTVVAAMVCYFSSEVAMKRHLPWIVLGGVLSIAMATALAWLGMSAWAWRLSWPASLGSTLKLLTWFAWPTLPLAFFTAWSWRRQILRRHIALPLFSALVGIAACICMGNSDRALLHSLPPLAVLAAFSLPAIKRGISAAIDWFSVFFFTLSAIGIWVIYAAIQTGWPAKTTSNVFKLLPGLTPVFSTWSLAIAIFASLAWLALVRWRTVKHRPVIWKSMVLPAGGVALTWLLLMTLLLAPIDQARSYRYLVDRVSRHVPKDACLQSDGASVGLMTALDYFGKHRVLGQNHETLGQATSTCRYLVKTLDKQQPVPKLEGWTFTVRVYQRNTRSESVAIYRR
jgi:hypothetical protein